MPNASDVVGTASSSDISAIQSNQRSLNLQKQKLDDAHSQALTGLKARTLSDIPLQLVSYLQSEDSLTQNASAQEQAFKAQTGTDMTVSQMKDVENITKIWRVRLKEVVGNPSNNTKGLQSSFKTEATDTLKRLHTILNGKDKDGKYLFGGTQRASAAVDLTPYFDPLQPAPDPNASADTSYYKGSSDTQQAMFSPHPEDQKSLGLLGNRTCFSELIYALRICATNNPTTGADDAPMQALRKAQEHLENGFTDLQSAKQNVCDDQVYLKRQDETLKREATILQEFQQKTVGVDQTQAITELLAMLPQYSMAQNMAFGALKLNSQLAQMMQGMF